MNIYALNVGSLYRQSRFVVAAPDKQEARRLTELHAKESGLALVTVNDCTRIDGKHEGEAGVIKVEHGGP